MQATVRSRFRGFNEPFEGVVPFMYQDILGFITVGVGNLIDPLSEAERLPFRFKSKPGIDNPGQLASRPEIIAEWNRIKGDASLAKKGHKACEPITDLELDDAAINDLISERLDDNEAILKKQAAFQDFDSWPADAQLGLLSMAWAMGANALHAFRRFSAGCRRLDFKVAARECLIKEDGNPGVIPRNRANRTLFLNAAAVVASAGDRAVLHFPAVLV
ncbi:MAG TPA: hypothetical protein VM120_01270 [Bryobacteraceae bacterium]|nr:hypothetical protein [Bryobacteraceae bacterium]